MPSGPCQSEETARPDGGPGTTLGSHRLRVVPWVHSRARASLVSVPYKTGGA
jgi:hypothetical protein